MRNIIAVLQKFIAQTGRSGFRGCLEMEIGMGQRFVVWPAIDADSLQVPCLIPWHGERSSAHAYTQYFTFAAQTR